jgi:outer membrane scaffolding protein for murein synthesis (MipA/OmpV family)
MTHRPPVSRSILSLAAVLLAGGISTPVQATEGENGSDGGDASVATAEAEVSVSAQPQPGDGAPARPAFDPVFDDTWATIGIGAGLVPSYTGSDDYIVFPLPLIAGRVAGIGIRPNGPGLKLDLNSSAQPPAPGAGGGPSFSFGPTFRIRNDRNANIEDEVVALAGELDLALEVGAAAEVTFPGVLTQNDRLSIGAQVRWDVLGAHDGMIIEPQVGYAVPLGRSALFALQAGLEFVDDDFADYYFSVSPAQSLASGLPEFTGEGGLNSVSTSAILSFDLDSNPLNGGWNIYGIAGYSRLVNDAADTPYTAIRGDADQFIVGAGVGYTF